MAKRIYKYEMIPREDLIGVHPEIHVQMPRDAEILRFDAQGDRMFVWAIVDPDREEARYSFLVLPTGAEVTWPSISGIKYLATMMMRGGSLVWHVFGDLVARP